MKLTKDFGFLNGEFYVQYTATVEGKDYTIKNHISHPFPMEQMRFILLDMRAQLMYAIEQDLFK